MAKSKVAPIKTISIPRLELCSALLLACLMSRVLSTLQSSPAGVFCWSDSQVTLAWLSNQPSKWTTFVVNWVSETLTTLPGASWSYVRTAENPADLASRGVMPEKLARHSLWWHGPPWLTSQWQQWMISKPLHTTTIDERKRCAAFATPLERKHEDSPVEAWLQTTSRLSTAIRALAYALRWSNRQQAGIARFAHPLSADELRRAEKALIHAVQHEHFSEDTARLQAHLPMPRASPLRQLLPYLDADGLIRVGGRLQNAMLTEGEKHPLIVPADSRIVDLLVRDAHLRTLHGGPQLVASLLLRRYWVIRSRNIIRKLVRQCVRCTRFRGQHQVQQMAPLPAVRVTPARPFASTGLDYAGPFMLRTSKGRGQKAYKGYVVIFLCMVTRAVHIEVVSDYTSHTFLAAFRRFVSRRGLCSVVYSDNGTTFQGASAELQRLFNASSQFIREVVDAVAQDKVSWIFIPPRAPHFGGLWEAGGKAFKHHLRRVLGEAKLTYEEFSTLATQIEACLNSRPLSPLSTNAEDVAALTPGHFLIGSALTVIPESLDDSLSVTGVPRYKWTVLMRNHFWRRWQAEVLRLLQQRQKWLDPNAALHEGDLVLIMDELQPPTKWPLARITQLHSGADGLTRVLTSPPDDSLTAGGSRLEDIQETGVEH